MLQKETCHKDIMSFSGLLYPTLFMLYKTLQTILEAWNTLHHFLFLDKGWLLQDKQKNVLGYFFVEEGGRRATLIFCSRILFACAVASLVNFGGQVKLEKWGLDALLLPLSCVKINDSECTRPDLKDRGPYILSSSHDSSGEAVMLDSPLPIWHILYHHIDRSCVQQ